MPVAPLLAEDLRVSGQFNLTSPEPRMATLLSIREEFLEPDVPSKRDSEATRELASRFDDMQFRQVVSDPFVSLQSKPVHGTRYLSLTTEHSEEFTAPSVVHGVSLYGVLQMLNLERKTCIVEIVSEQRFGTITLVNGELVDADVDGIEGEPAVYEILSWDHPQTTIMDGVSLFRHTVNLPIAKLLVESVRLQDEIASTSDKSNVYTLVSTSSPRQLETLSRIADWNWLVETLVIGGAKIAAVIRAQDESVLAAGNEYGGMANATAANDLAGLASICRSTRRWARMVDPGVTELILRIADDQILISPIDHDRQVFAYAVINANDSLEFVRGAIRSVMR